MHLSKEEVLNNVFEHSQAKLDFYKNYLYKYVSILLNDKHTDKIDIYDIFCGIGIYDDGNYGSPIIAIQIIQDLKAKFPQKEITLIINDKDSNKVNFVTEYISKNYKDACKLQSYNLDALEMITIVKDCILKSNQKTKSLVFIDPYGYKNIYKKDICDIMSKKSSEIILFLPIAQMYRFINGALEDDKNKSYSHLRRFINEFFNQNHPVVTAKLESQLQYIQYIKDAFTCNKNDYSASYSIQRNNSTYYALFFITNHIYGLDRIVDTKWKLDNNCGEGFTKNDVQHLFTDLFEESKQNDCLGNLREQLIMFLSEYKTNNEIYEFVLKLGFLPKQASDILKILDKEKLLIYNVEIKNRYFYIGWKYFKSNDIKYSAKIKKVLNSDNSQ